MSTQQPIRMTETIENSTQRVIKGKPCIYYDGYWIRHYHPPEDTLLARKGLIMGLTRRTFHLTEPGINTPGEKLEMARAAYEAETDPARKRVKAAMLAGALFNRATDIFTKLVDLVSKGVEINTDNELMVQCGKYFQEALSLARNVHHYSGHEGIDELWGEPLKAFTMPIHQFYESRYIKIAQTMHDIDLIAARLIGLCAANPAFEGIEPLILELATASRLECETIKSDPVIFDVWPRFVTASEAVEAFCPRTVGDLQSRRRIKESIELLREGKNVMTYLAAARVPMRKSTTNFLERCDAFGRQSYRTRATDTEIAATGR